MVPQDVDHIVQSVQPILHLRLQKSKPESELMMSAGLGTLARWPVTTSEGHS